MEFDYSCRPYDGRINIWRRENGTPAWVLVRVVDEVSDAWAWIAGQHRKRHIWHGAAA